MKDHTTELNHLLDALNVPIRGIALTERAADYIYPEFRERFILRYPYAIVMGYPISRGIVDECVDGPTIMYKHHYKTVNYLLDQTAYKVFYFIQEQGFHSVPVSSSQIVNWEAQWGHLSHKVFGYYAGIGWIGRSTLLIHPKYHAHARYVTVLTDLPLTVNEPYDSSDCGDCTDCIDACPVKAINQSAHEYDKQLCIEMLKKYQGRRGIGVMICGICIRACKGKR